MPELPEVTTTVTGIKDHCIGWTIADVWSDLPQENPTRVHFNDTIKYIGFFNTFKKNIIGQKITGSTRRAKNILIELSSKHTILIHMKMTGHMMVGNYTYSKKNNTWTVSESEKNNNLRDPYNRFLHLVITLKKGAAEKHLVMSDSRKFAKVTLLTHEADREKHLGNIGPEPINPDIPYNEFIQVLHAAPGKNRPIKTLLMDAVVIAGIGNIYSDELLFRSNVHPESRWINIPTIARKRIHAAMLSVLKKGIDFGGDSTSDYRDIHGARGGFQDAHLAYRKTGSPCSKKSCTGTITRKVINGRSAHFCPVHQTLYT